MAASMVLRNFDLAFDDDPASIREVFALTMGPDRLPIRLSRRAD
jgi:hypothetical protein